MEDNNVNNTNNEQETNISEESKEEKTLDLAEPEQSRSTETHEQSTQAGSQSSQNGTQNSQAYGQGTQNGQAYGQGTQNSQTYNQNGQQYNQNYNRQYNPNQYRPEKKKSRFVNIVIIAAVILAVFFVFSSIFSVMMRIFSGRLIGTGKTGSDDSLNISGPYIAELSVNGTIQGDADDSLTSQQSYHHSWTLSKIKSLKNDTNNRGLILFVNTPGGGVYESDELYLAIKDYKESTGRPVYSYMASEAASGGYYISAPCDRIFANRNCWTGSIGVTIGTLYDITGLLEKYGVKTVSIHAGKNKAMGSYTEELTKEQQEILKSLVDEAYDQFVGIVAEGRKMKVEEVKKLADGRIYTAKQAKENGLIDEIGTFDEAVAEMKKTYELDGCTVQELEYPKKDSFLRDLLQSVSGLREEKLDTDLDRLQALMDNNGKFSVTYLAQIDR